jgi:peptidoglycan/xylan/chitin deacetylase (PgdA/CDA1 family)
MTKHLTQLLAVPLIALAASSFAGSAKILLYHHVSSDTPAATSVTEETFESHLDLIESGGYEVVPLQKIVDVLVNGGDLESNWVAITFDDAYRSILTAALPRLRKRNWPFTVFTSTEFVDKQFGLYLTWEELRELESAGATIANHTVSHEHMVRMAPGESHEDWKARLTGEVIQAQNRLEAELENPQRLFAYPFGEFDADIADLMQSLGFISFGQQSGPVGSTTNLYAIPRFPLASGFDSVDSLAEKLRTEHLPLTDPPVPAVVLEAESPPPTLSLTIQDARVRPESLTCFVAGQPPAEVIWPETDTFEVTATKPLKPGRSKYTCTAPHPTIRRAYYWHTQLWIKPRADGSWYEG